ncbi:hypothetical protein ARMSODRAFT_1010503 [Armillaria solidipes]|uniref:Uncharacterized protein n=1 Tax=Armillaria solidipes TaxID=1076256 RepID=A0A2H3C967_9AGAR|nr:hypothetical protein ARMSODRAFT_1010503 [Armillaria solidipes]
MLFYQANCIVSFPPQDLNKPFLTYKEALCKHNCKDFMMEDSDPEAEISDGKIRKGQKPYGDNLGIPALNNLFILDMAPKEEDSEKDEDEDSKESEDESESTKDKDNAPAESMEDVEMTEMVNAVGAPNV